MALCDQVDQLRKLRTDVALQSYDQRTLFLSDSFTDLRSQVIGHVGCSADHAVDHLLREFGAIHSLGIVIRKRIVHETHTLFLFYFVIIKIHQLAQLPQYFSIVAINQPEMLGTADV